MKFNIRSKTSNMKTYIFLIIHIFDSENSRSRFFKILCHLLTITLFWLLLDDLQLENSFIYSYTIESAIIYVSLSNVHMETQDDTSKELNSWSI